MSNTINYDTIICVPNFEGKGKTVYGLARNFLLDGEVQPGQLLDEYLVERGILTHGEEEEVYFTDEEAFAHVDIDIIKDLFGKRAHVVEGLYCRDHAADAWLSTAPAPLRWRDEEFRYCPVTAADVDDMDTQEFTDFFNAYAAINKAEPYTPGDLEEPGEDGETDLAQVHKARAYALEGLDEMVASQMADMLKARNNK